MGKGYAKASGAEFERVTVADILARCKDWATAEEIGWDLWPHLRGRGPVTGGPSSCAVAATFQLSKLEHAGKVRSRSDRGPRKFIANRS